VAFSPGGDGVAKSPENKRAPISASLPTRGNAGGVQAVQWSLPG
jgi:hypothetical protein